MVDLAVRVMVSCRHKQVITAAAGVVSFWRMFYRRPFSGDTKTIA